MKTGDLVQLKSGGPVMTVEDPQWTHGGPTRVLCVWFEYGVTRREGSFKEGMLASASGPKASKIRPGRASTPV